MTHGSLFSGIGGFDLGFERAGIKTVWQVEIDPFCRKVLERHFPDARRYHNIKRVKRFAAVDVISGGFPCQDISQAGKRAGITGSRSGLWSEMWRVIRSVRPRFVVVENVAALLGRGIERVIGDLASIGYDAEWDCIPAHAVGAPHLRDRIWIIAYPASDLRGTSRHDRPEPFDGSGAPTADAMRHGSQAGISGQNPREEGHANLALDCGQTEFAGTIPDASIERHGITEAPVLARRIGIERCSWWATEPDVGRVAHGIPARVDRLKGLGNAIVPQIAEWIGRRIIEAEA